MEELFDEFELVLKAVKADDVEAFTQLYKKCDCKRLCFGKFPILSACYLLNSKKIIKVYEKDLIKQSSYIIVDDDFELYEKFKRLAGRCLRIYVYETQVVSPLEMLMILGRTGRIKTLYNEAYKTSTIKRNLSKIETIRTGRPVSATETNIDIPKQPLSKFAKNMIVSVVAIMIVAMLICSAAIGMIVSSGTGTSSNPIKINNSSQLSLALTGNKNYILNEDIEIDSFNIEEFSGSINGNGHTVTVNNCTTRCLINKLSGSISNLKIVINDATLDVDVEYSTIFKENAGVIKNVDIVATLDLTMIGTSEENRMVTILALTNNGEIDNCTINGDIKLHGNTSVNSLYGSFIGINNSTITNCNTLDEMSIDSDTFDLAGLVIINSSGAKISSCSNCASIVQISSSEEWNPRVSGVVGQNDGTIESIINKGSINMSAISTEAVISGIVFYNRGEVLKCLNEGEIVANINTNTQSIQSSLYIGGIAGQNFATIESCKNKGDICLNIEESIVAYAGGISSYNGNEVETNAIIKSSGSESNIELIQAENSFAFLGGVVGYAYSGYVTDNFANVTMEYDSELKAYAGGVIGVVNFAIWYYTKNTNNGYIANNSYLIQSNYNNGLGAAIESNYVSICENVGVTKYTTIQGLIGSEVYWE